MTNNEIMNIPAGRELDRVIAEKVFGYETQEGGNWCKCKDKEGIIELLNYSTDMNDAMELARHFIIQGKFILNYLKSADRGKGWHCNINDHHVHGCQTPAGAICRAALVAVMGDSEQHV